MKNNTLDHHFIAQKPARTSQIKLNYTMAPMTLITTVKPSLRSKDGGDAGSVVAATLAEKRQKKR
jgi:hypothetical protein